MLAHIRSEREHVTDTTCKVERYKQIICKTRSESTSFQPGRNFTIRVLTLSLRA